MIVEIDGKEHFFDENKAIVDEKYNPIIKKLYYILFGINILNIVLYIKNIHDNWFFPILFPLFHTFIYFIFWIIKSTKTNSDGDNQYIITYYPDIAKKIYIYGHRFPMEWKNFVDGEYIGYNKDFILDDIRDRHNENISLLTMPIKLFLFFFISVTLISFIFK
jgi:hypothetical protein